MPSKPWNGRSIWQDMARETKHRPSLLSPEEIDELLRRGAESARELSKQIAPCFRLTAAQRNLVLR
jgi:hypothetical protein